MYIINFKFNLHKYNNKNFIINIISVYNELGIFLHKM